MQSILFGVCSAVIAALGYWRGFRAIFYGAWKPSLSTWSIWVTLDALLVAQGYLSGARGTLWQLGIYLAGALIVVALAVRYGERRWSRVDSCCTVGAVVSIAVWLITKSPQIALLCSVGAHFMGALPTVLSGWSSPEREDLTTWGLFLLSTYVNIGAIESWSPSSWPTILWPVYGAIWLSILVFLIRFPRAFGRTP